MNWIRMSTTSIVAVALATGCAGGSDEAAEGMADGMTADGAMAAGETRLNPMVALLAEKQPAFGLYAPSNRRFRPGSDPLPEDSVKTPEELAALYLTQPMSDYVFDGSMEGNFDRGYEQFSGFAAGLEAAGFLAEGGAVLKAPMFVKTPEIAPDTALAKAHIQQQLDLGVAGIVFVGVETADELRLGINAMRYAANGGTRPDGVGQAAARWGLSDEEYRAKADVWPLNPNGELMNFAIVESELGLENVREIAAVEGIGVLFPGAGTLRGMFSTVGEDGQRVLDAEAWEASIQKVLAACKEFDVACGYPAGAADIEERMEQGFSVFVIGWGDQGFEAVSLGRAKAGR